MSSKRDKEVRVREEEKMDPSFRRKYKVGLQDGQVKRRRKSGRHTWGKEKYRTQST